MSPRKQCDGRVRVPDKGKYALASPTPGGLDWWQINDMEKMYAVVTVQAQFPNAEAVIMNAWNQIPD